MRLRRAAFALLLPLIGCGSPETPSETMVAAEPARGCVHDNGAWCITNGQVAVTQETEKSVHWTFRDAEDNSGLIVEPPSCRGRPADGVYVRTTGTVLREGGNWRIRRIGLREDRTCELLFMAPETAAESLENVFLTGVNVCLQGTACASARNALSARVGEGGLF